MYFSNILRDLRVKEKARGTIDDAHGHQIVSRSLHITHDRVEGLERELNNRSHCRRYLTDC